MVYSNCTVCSFASRSSNLLPILYFVQSNTGLWALHIVIYTSIVGTCKRHNTTCVYSSITSTLVLVAFHLHALNVTVLQKQLSHGACRFPCAAGPTHQNMRHLPATISLSFRRVQNGSNVPNSLGIALLHPWLVVSCCLLNYSTYLKKEVVLLLSISRPSPRPTAGNTSQSVAEIPMVVQLPSKQGGHKVKTNKTNAQDLHKSNSESKPAKST